ncbi:hypothetical protein NKH77_51740 [Streptomyces sp. M19]
MEILLVLLAGAAAGGLNAVGGGGTFVALPVLVQVGLSPVTANASSTIALVPERRPVRGCTGAKSPRWAAWRCPVSPR